MRSGFVVLGSNRPDQRRGLFALQFMGNGWIKLHRQLQLKGYYKQSQYIHLWVHLLLCANHKRTEYMTNGQIIHIKEGQLLTGRKLLAEGTGIPETTIERILKVLESEHQIEQQKTTKYRLITIVKWDTYQKVDSTSDSKRTTNGQQTDTNKNVKKVKKEKNNPASQDDALVSSVIKAFEEVDPKNKGYYGNTTQRAACSFLIAEYGLEEVLKRVKVLPRTNKVPYFPSITTPYQLKEKWVQLQDKVDQKRGELKAKEVKII